MTNEQLKALPKAELHCHLDGSLSREFMESRLGRRVQPEELSVSDDCTSLAEYLEKFSLPGQCIMDEKGLESAGYDTSHHEPGECALRRNPFCTSSFRELRNELPCCDRGDIKRPRAGQS